VQTPSELHAPIALYARDVSLVQVLFGGLLQTTGVPAQVPVLPHTSFSVHTLASSHPDIAVFRS
jgi:hypothetical protein